MSDLSDFFEQQDEREMEWECGALSPYGDWCAKPIDHDGLHRTSWKANGWAIWSATRIRRGTFYTPFAQSEQVKDAG